MEAKFVFLLVVGLVGTLSVNANPRPHHRALHDDLEDFIALVPTHEVLAIFMEYVKHDAEVQYVLEYVQSTEFRELLDAVESIPDVVAFYNYLDAAGLDVYWLVNKLYEYVGLPPLVPPKKFRFTMTGGIAGLIADVKGILPIEDIKALYHHKLETSPEFKKLSEEVHSPKYQAILDTLRANPEYQAIVKEAKEFGVDVKAIADLLTTVLGLQFPQRQQVRMSRGLREDLEDFLALVPKDKVAQIFYEYLKHDAQVQYVVEYIQTAEFRELVKAMESIPDVISFYNYLQESGLDVYYLVNQLHEYIGLPPLFPSKKFTFTITGGVAGLIADIKAVLPIEDIKALYHHKLETSPEFKNLVKRLQSPKFQAVVDTLRANPEYQAIVKKAKEFGVDVKAIADLLTTVLGIQFPQRQQVRMSRGLREDLEDFLALVPKDKVAQIFYEYLKHDAQVQYVVEYVQTVEFRELVKAMESIPDVISFYNYLQESGLDVYYLVNQLHEYIGLPPLIPPRKFTFTITGGVAGLIADIKAVLPIEDIKALYYHKLETSPDFKNLVKRLQSPKFQAVVDALRANPEFQEIVKKAKAVGVDVKEITDLLSTVLGLKFPSINSQVSSHAVYFNYDEFLDLPFAEVAKVWEYYSNNNEEIVNLLLYFQTQEFKKIVEFIDHIANVRHMYQYLDESGLDIYRIVNALRRVINLPGIQPQRKSVEVTGGLRGLFKDIRRVFPTNEFIALHKEKMQRDPIYKAFIGRIHSDQFKGIIEAVISDHDFVTATAELQLNGFDVEFVIEVVKYLLNFHNRMSLNRTLEEDINDFVSLIPVDEIAEISFKFILYDTQVQEAVRYVRSQELRELMILLQHDSDVYEFLKYLEDSGVHIISIIDMLNDSLGIPPYPIPDNLMGNRNDLGGVQKMLEEIRAIMPYAAIKDMYNEKMAHSEEFRYVIKRLEDPEFQKIVDKMVVNKNVVELGYQAQLHGINIENISKFLTDIFGITLPEVPFPLRDFHLVEEENSLSNDFADFFDLLLTDAIFSVTFEYALHDEEMQKVMAYIKSEEFKNIVRSLHKIPEYNQILDKLEAAEVNIEFVIKLLHDFIGFEEFYRNHYHNHAATQKAIEKPGLNGYIETIKELLPYKEIKALYHEKLETSKAFAEFITLMSSETFQTLTNKLFENVDFQKLLHKAQTHGVDVQAIADFFLRVFGIKTPPGIIDY